MNIYILCSYLKKLKNFKTMIQKNLILLEKYLELWDIKIVNQFKRRMRNSLHQVNNNQRENCNLKIQQFNSHVNKVGVI